MGRPNVNWNVGIALEKHSTYTSKTVKAGIPFASQVTEPNTKYIIKYDFDLDGNTIKMPEDCILEFDGGKLYNGLVVSTDTILSGKIEDSCPLVGAFKNGSGEYLDFDYKSLKSLKSNIGTGLFINRGVRYFPSRSAGGLAVDDNYILLLTYSTGQEYDINQTVQVFDRNYNYIGSTSFSSTSHCNSACIKDGIFYVVDSGSVEYAPVNVIVENAANGVETVFTKKEISGGGFIFYDSKTDCFYTRGTHNMYVLDSKFNVIDDTLANPYETLDTYLHSIGLGMNEDIEVAGNYNNDCFIKNGICVIGVSFGYFTAAKPSGYVGNSAFIPYIAKVDIYNNKVIQLSPIECVSFSDEVEGIYPISDSKYLCSIRETDNLTDNNTFMFVEIDKEEIDYNWEKSNTIYVDNTFTGISLGTVYAPYKKLEDVLIREQLSPSYTIALVCHKDGNGNQTNDPYIVSEAIIKDSNIKFVGRDIKNTPSITSVIFPFTAENCSLKFDNIRFEKNTGVGVNNITTNNGSCSFTNCEIYNNIRSNGSNCDFTNCILNSKSNDNPSVYGNMTIKADYSSLNFKGCEIYCRIDDSKSTNISINDCEVDTEGIDAPFILQTFGSCVISGKNIDTHMPIRCRSLYSGSSRLSAYDVDVYYTDTLIVGSSITIPTIEGRGFLYRNTFTFIGGAQNSPALFYPRAGCDVVTCYVNTAQELETCIDALSGKQRSDGDIYWCRLFVKEELLYEGNTIYPGCYYVKNDGTLVGTSFTNAIQQEVTQP